MPTYEYECRACGHAFETMHSMTAPVLRKCPECGKLKLERLISGGAGVIFKGSGFYETDYKRNRGGGSADRGSSETKKPEPAKADASEKKSDAKSDAKPAAKPEGKPKRD
jgi:putative FmdB family regulatory protein